MILGSLRNYYVTRTSQHQTNIIIEFLGSKLPGKSVLGTFLEYAHFSEFTLFLARTPPSEKGYNCWAKYESTCDFLPNNDGTTDNAADQTGPTGLITLTHMQCDGGYTYVTLSGNLSCPNCDSNKQVKLSAVSPT